MNDVDNELSEVALSLGVMLKDFERGEDLPICFNDVRPFARSGSLGVDFFVAC